MSPKIFAIPREKIVKVIEYPGGGIASDRITVDGLKIGYMYREAAIRKEDSGWRFFSGDEDTAYTKSPSHFEAYAINTIANYDPDIIPYLNTPAPCAFEKIAGTHKYRRIPQ